MRRSARRVGSGSGLRRAPALRAMAYRGLISFQHTRPYVFPFFNSHARGRFDSGNFGRPSAARVEADSDGRGSMVVIRVEGNCFPAVVYFKIRRTTQMRKMMEAYCLRSGLCSRGWSRPACALGGGRRFERLM